MQFERTELPGVFVVESESTPDERGWFMRTFCAEEFAAAGLEPVVAQTSVSFNTLAGTLRGMHWQAEPFGEHKLVRCSQGRLFDVAVDVRRDSATFGRWISIELSASGGRSLYLSPLIAHGFVTLEDSTEVTYSISRAYAPESARGFRWDDAAVGIRWPRPPSVLSARDREWPSLSDASTV